MINKYTTKITVVKLAMPGKEVDSGSLTTVW